MNIHHDLYRLSYCLSEVYLNASETQTRCRASHGSVPIATLPEHKAIIAHASPIWAENKTRWENKHHCRGRKCERTGNDTQHHCNEKQLTKCIYDGKVQSSNIRPLKAASVESELSADLGDQGTKCSDVTVGWLILSVLQLLEAVTVRFD